MFLEGGFVDVMDVEVCYQETANELDLYECSDVFIDCIQFGSHFTAFGFGGGGGLSSFS